jgi:hypothetical protein
MVSLVQLRPPWEFPEKLRFVIEALSIGENNEVVGSYKYQAYKYPNDVDLRCYYKVELEKFSASKYYTKRLQAIFKQLLAYQKVAIVDFKAGIDQRYSNIKSSKELTRELFTSEEIAELSTLTPKEFKVAIKEYYTIRWTPEEVIAGVKVKNGRSVTLAGAIAQNAIVKLDVITWVLDRFLSIECFYDLEYQDGKFYRSKEYIEMIIDDLYKYSSPEYFSPLKVLKRLWILGRAIDCKKLLQDITPILSSNASALSQIGSDINVLIDMMDFLESDDDYQLFFTELLGLEGRINNHIPPNDYVTLNVWNEYSEHLQGKEVNFESLEDELRSLKGKLNSYLLEEATAFYERINKSPIVC